MSRADVAAPRNDEALDFDSLLDGPDPPANSADEIPHAHPEETGGVDATQTLEPSAIQPSWEEFQQAWELYRDPIWCAVLAGAALGALGVFIVLRRAVFVTAAVSQSAALGVALAFYSAIHLQFAISPSVSAFALAAAATALLALNPRRPRLPRETVLGATFIASSALVLLVGNSIAQEAHDVSAILFGSAVLVRQDDLLAVAISGLLVTGFLALFFRGLCFAGFDPQGARVQRIPVRTLELALWTIVALEVSITTRALGALPVFAFAVLPAMTALSVVSRLPRALLLAAGLGCVAGGAGYLVAYFWQLPVGASQAAVAIGMFVFTVTIRATLNALTRAAQVSGSKSAGGFSD